jgi:hypothetical protein
VGHEVLDFFHHGTLPGNIDYSKNVAFLHPTLDGVYVFINQDMPHTVKRIVNTLESSNPSNGKKRALSKYNGGVLEQLCLAMIKRAWEHVGGGNPGAIRDEHTRAMTRQHFEKDCFSCMRVSLAVQVVSARAAGLLKRIKDGETGRWSDDPLPDGERARLTSLIDLCEKTNRIVDIMNARGEEHGAPILNSPRAPLIDEVLDILKWFADWRSELVAAGHDVDKEVFFPRELWEDLNGLLLGVACTSRFYLAYYPGESLLQRRFDQDPCEHHFNHVRGSAGATRNPDAYQCRQATSIAGDLHAGGLTGGGTGNSGKGQVEAPVLAALPRRGKTRNV